MVQFAHSALSVYWMFVATFPMSLSNVAHAPSESNWALIATASRPHKHINNKQQLHDEIQRIATLEKEHKQTKAEVKKRNEKIRKEKSRPYFL